MISLGLFFGVFVVQLPVLAVLVVGLILLATQGARLPRRSLQLARAGLVVMLAESFGSIAWSVLLPQIISRLDYEVGWTRTYGLISAGVGLVLALLFATGIGLLIGAVLAARQPGPPPFGQSGSPPPSWAPPGSLPPGSVPPSDG
ncbi:hypothetical protein ACIA5D_02930 [Actinoplanes sp. NPDC051513]|uniref:hypothetical protein n=1 Tax=Actinoplanes sp. NPDC051513 TaxID=3363908 RepID=UPI003796CC03